MLRRQGQPAVLPVPIDKWMNDGQANSPIPDSPQLAAQRVLANRNMAAMSGRNSMTPRQVAAIGSVAEQAGPSAAAAFVKQSLANPQYKNTLTPERMRAQDAFYVQTLYPEGQVPAMYEPGKGNWRNTAEGRAMHMNNINTIGKGDEGTSAQKASDARLGLSGQDKYRAGSGDPVYSKDEHPGIAKPHGWHAGTDERIPQHDAGGPAESGDGGSDCLNGRAGEGSSSAGPSKSSSATTG